MDNTNITNQEQSIIKIENQLYDIKISKVNDIINILLTNNITFVSYACALDTDAVVVITTKGKYIRDIDEFYEILTIGAKNIDKSEVKITGKTNTDNTIILLANVQLSTTLKNKDVTYSITLEQLTQKNVTRVEAMMLAFDTKQSNIRIDIADLQKNIQHVCLSIDDLNYADYDETEVRFSEIEQSILAARTDLTECLNNEQSLKLQLDEQTRLINKIADYLKNNHNYV